MEKNKLLVIINIIAAICSIIVVTSANAYGHYATILAVFIPIDMALIVTILEEKESTLNLRMIVPLFCVLLIMLCSSDVEAKIISFVEGYNESSFESASKEIISNIPIEEREDVIGYNVSSLFYLYTDITPCFKYFTLQDWQSSKSDVMIDENVAFYESQQAKWLVIEDTVDIDEIAYAISMNYTLYKSFIYESNDEEHSLFLYYRNE